MATNNAADNVTAASGTVLQGQGVGTASAFSTATYPASTTANQLLVSSATNVVSGLTTGNNSTLVTDGSGVPSISATLPSAVQSNITTVGTVTTGTWSATSIAANKGGTGQTSYSTGDILYASGATTLSKLPIGSAGQILSLSGSTPSWVTYTQIVNYVDAVLVATTGALTASYNNGVAGVGAFLLNTGALASFSVDGQTPAINSRVLVKNQASSFQNGVYTLTTVGSGAIAWVLTRSTDYNTPAEINAGDVVPCQTGTVNANTSWMEGSTVATIGTDPITFTQYQSAPVSTTQYAVLVGGANNAVASLPIGSAGQVLQSSGAGVNPAYSTPTLPTGSGSTGVILRSDGTNNVYTTATFPATTTSQQLLYSSAANTIGGLATGNSLLAATNSSGTLAMRAFSVVVQVFTGNGTYTYTPTAGMLYCTCETIGSGGGGAGVPLTGAGAVAAGGGGGAGGYARKTVSKATIGASQTITIGAGGTGGTGNAAGNNGNTSSVGVIVTASGGTGGANGGAAATSCNSGGSGGAGASGDVNITGQSGFPSFGVFNAATSAVASGAGGASLLGGGGTSRSGQTASSGNGNAGSNYGSGGSGAINTESQGTARNGGAGSDGIVVITEFVIA